MEDKISQFYGNLEGQAKTQATRRGSKISGIRGHLRGWNVGIEVIGSVDPQGKDMFEVWLTSGSNGHKHSKLIGVYHESNLD